MKRKANKLISLCLVLAMALTLFPMSVSADDAGTAVVVDGVEQTMDLSPYKTESGYDFSSLDLSDTTIFKNGADDAYLLTVEDETYLVGDTSLARWVGSWESWGNYIYPDAATQAAYPYLDQVWDLAYDAYIKSFAQAGIDMTQQMPNTDALKSYWNSIATTRDVKRLTVTQDDSGKYTITWLGENDAVLAEDTYVMTGKMLKGFEGAEAYVFTAENLDEASDYKYFISMVPGMEGDEETQNAGHYHFQFGSSLDDMLLKGERYNSTNYGTNDSGRPISSNLKNSGWYATMIDEDASALAKYNVILGMHMADKWSKLPGSGGGSSTGNTGNTTTTETVTNPDGSTTTTVIDKKTGTVTKTTEYKDGATLVVETKSDGTVTTTDTAADDVIVKTIAASGKDVTAHVTLPKGVGEATVTIPATVDYGVVAKDAESGEIIKLSVPTAEGMLVKLDRSADLVLVKNARDFSDTANHWAKDAIDFTTAHGLFAGTSDTTFSPESDMTRAMLMAVLARFDGYEASSGSVWYEKAMEWAVENGISDGTNPDAAITREQLATMLWRYAGSPTVSASDADRFSDADNVSDFAAEAMNWAVHTGLISGMDDSTLSPQGQASRAQVATILMRYVENMTI